MLIIVFLVDIIVLKYYIEIKGGINIKKVYFIFVILVVAVLFTGCHSSKEIKNKNKEAIDFINKNQISKAEELIALNDDISFNKYIVEYLSLSNELDKELKDKYYSGVAATINEIIYQEDSIEHGSDNNELQDAYKRLTNNVKSKIFEYIRTSNFSEANQMLIEMNNIDDDFRTLDSYNNLLFTIKNYPQNYDLQIRYYENIPTDYNGMFAKEILKTKDELKETINLKKQKSDAEWIKTNKELAKSVEKKKQKENELQRIPHIGMTAEELYNSTWGKPQDINKTTTKYGISEQWVYSNNRYVYLEDGVVVAIQE